jgi:four helix bundle protein
MIKEKIYYMKENNIIQQKTFDFGVSIIKFCEDLKKCKKETVLANQLLRCGTSIGANVEEGLGSQSKKDFYFKLTIAYKEARETMYWLRIIQGAGILEKERMISVIYKCDEILRILGSILKTLRNNSASNT